MPANAQHPDYYKMSKRWELVRRIIANDAKCYIRWLDDNDMDRSEQYQNDAILTNFTRLTKDGLTGLVSRKPAVMMLPDELDYILEDATGEGLTLEQLSYKIVGEVLQTGIAGLMTDYPKTDGTLSQAELETVGYKSRMKLYTAENIINFKRRFIGNEYVLSLVVLREYIDADDTDMFSWEQRCQYRVLRLDEQGRYLQEVYDDAVDPQLVEGPYYPLDSAGNYWTKIPFSFIGAENNDPEYDEIPLYDLAVLNLGHYRNSADLEESGFINGQPMLVINIGDTDVNSFNTSNPNGIRFGSRSSLTVGNGGSAQLLQANPNQLMMTMMKQKEDQASAIGARLIAPPGGRETAEGARIRYGSQNSSLYILTCNVSLAIQKELQNICKFEGIDGSSIIYQLNKQFYDESADPNLIAQQIMLFDRKIIPAEEIIEYGQKTGFISDAKDYEDILNDASANEVAISATPVEDNATV